ncbi:uncharacterized protein isoform X2 [Choristoneura fumiferana]|uniref:uncharacterized protein isoform X2 n=1 Tax=Choristoneura fumiferana TaxID=7141 RepID=UPI003D15A52D
MELLLSLIKLSTVPESVSAALVTKLPVFTDVIRNAISEIDVLDELIAYRIETKSVEIVVAPADHCIACVVYRSRRKRKHKKQ